MPSTKEQSIKTFERYFNLITALTAGVAATRLTLNSLRDDVGVLGESTEELVATEHIQAAIPYLERASKHLVTAHRSIMGLEAARRAG